MGNQKSARHEQRDADHNSVADSVSGILARLEPISSSVVRTPLSAEEVHTLETTVGVPIPSCVREYLRTMGLFQDLTAYGTSEYEVLDCLDQFRKDREVLVKNFGQSAANLFPFAGDGAGDIIAVAEEPEGGMLFFADHETLEIKKIGTFCDWLSSVVESALKKERPANAEKRWCVQFSFRLSSPEPILTVMRQLGTASLGEWSEPKISPSDVHSFEAPLFFGKDHLTLKRSEYWTWEQPMFSLDYNEPVGLAASNSVIRKLDAGFREASLAYTLVDYGPLSLEWGETESTNQSAQTPWARLWSKLTRPI